MLWQVFWCLGQLVGKLFPPYLKPRKTWGPEDSSPFSGGMDKLFHIPGPCFVQPGKRFQTPELSKPSLVLKVLAMEFGLLVALSAWFQRLVMALDFLCFHSFTSPCLRLDKARFGLLGQVVLHSGFKLSGYGKAACFGCALFWQGKMPFKQISAAFFPRDGFWLPPQVNMIIMTKELKVGQQRTMVWVDMIYYFGSAKKLQVRVTTKCNLWLWSVCTLVRWHYRTVPVEVTALPANPFSPKFEAAEEVHFLG